MLVILMSLSPGEHISHYRIIEKIGEGGMGQVYRAWDERLERTVAIKLIGRGADDAGAKERLLREARLASSLNHPGICVIHEVNEEGDRPYIVMEFIEGKPLSAVIGEEGLPLPTLVRYAAQIAGALAHAHERGVVHRDLKSGNVVVTPEGRAKVLDFGLAKRTVETSAESAITHAKGPLTGPGVAVGTLEYMPPEVLRGEPADARGDLWALGVVMYEMCSARHPFRGKTGFEASAAILREDPEALSSRVNPGLRAVIERCLVKEPARRYQSAGEVKAALEALQSSASAAPARRRAKSARSIKSLAVLPLENLSGDASQDFFADGMTEALITGLARIGTLRVISRTSAMAYKGVHKPVPEIARELNVDAVVEGAILRSGDQVRITAQLVLAATDEHLWVETYDRPLANVLDLQSEVACAIAQEIKVKLTPREKATLTKARRVDPAAYEAYLRGRFAWNKRNEQGMRQGIEFFQKAIEADPTYALAHSGLADCYSVLGFYGALPPVESLGRAKAAAARALEFEKDLGEAHCSMAYVLQHYDRDFAGAERSYRTALELNPGYATSHHFSAILHLALGRTREAVSEMEKAEALDPLSRIIAAARGWVLLYCREYESAIPHYLKALDLAPDFWIARLWLGRAYAGLGRFAEGIATIRTAVTAEPSTFMPEALLAYVLALAGEREEATSIVERMETGTQQRYVMPYAVAIAHTGLGNVEAALDWLDRSLAERGSQLCYLGVDPAFDPLRAHPRFKELLSQVGLPA